MSIILGLVGDGAAAGKTTLTRGIAEILGPERVTCFCADDYHNYDRTERAANGITPLYPDCNYMEIIEQHLRLLRSGQPILKPVYNHSSGSLARTEYVVPCDLVIMDGLLGFSTPGLQECFDNQGLSRSAGRVTLPPETKRDCAKRGYRPEQAIKDLLKREPDSRDFIRPQRAAAGAVVRFYPPNENAQKQG